MLNPVLCRQYIRVVIEKQARTNGAFYRDAYRSRRIKNHGVNIQSIV